jgi:hypothetical protein
MSTNKFFIITGTNLIMGLENIIDWSNNTKSRLKCDALAPSIMMLSFFYLYLLALYLC